MYLSSYCRVHIHLSGLSIVDRIFFSFASFIQRLVLVLLVCLFQFEFLARQYIFTKIRLSIAIFVECSLHFPLALSVQHEFAWPCICKIGKSHIFHNMQFPLWWKRCNAYLMHSYHWRSFSSGSSISFTFIAIVVPCLIVQNGNKFDRIDAVHTYTPHQQTGGLCFSFVHSKVAVIKKGEYPAIYSPYFCWPKSNQCSVFLLIALRSFIQFECAYMWPIQTINAVHQYISMVPFNTC